MKIKHAILVLVAAITRQTFAATEFPNGLVPAELITEFSGGGSVYSSLPDGFPVAPSLAGLPVTLVGSVVRAGGRSQQILLRSPLGVDELRARFLSAYIADGWSDISSASEPGVCRDDKGQIYFRLSAEGVGTKVSIVRATPSPMPSPSAANCAQIKQLMDMQTGGIGSGFGLPGLGVELTLPPSATQSIPVRAFISGGGSSSVAGGMRYELEGEGSFQLANYSLTQLFQHFSQQLVQQGWQVDSDSVGNKSAVSVWFKTFSVTAADNKTYEVKANAVLKLLKTGDAAYEYRTLVEGVVPSGVAVTPTFVRPAF